MPEDVFCNNFLLLMKVECLSWALETIQLRNFTSDSQNWMFHHLPSAVLKQLCVLAHLECRLRYGCFIVYYKTENYVSISHVFYQYINELYFEKEHLWSNTNYFLKYKCKGMAKSSWKGLLFPPLPIIPNFIYSN